MRDDVNNAPLQFAAALSRTSRGAKNNHHHPVRHGDGRQSRDLVLIGEHSSTN